jgi:predicted GNAT family acetyltransferase
MVFDKVKESTSSVDVEIVSISQKSELKTLVEYLKPHETHALFLIGNFMHSTCESTIYVAKRKGVLVGVCGCYPTFQSCSIFSEDVLATESFAKIVLRNHPCVKTVLGMADVVKPAYDVFVASGKKSTRDPELLFLELSMQNFVPHVFSEGIIRQIRKDDVDRVARLQRLIDNVSADAPLTDEEKSRVLANPMTFCLEVSGKIVAVASSNGLAIQVFQILGVATDPEYRRRGYAKSLCSHLISVMKEQGATKAIVFTGKENIAALQCYSRLGFQLTDRYYCPWFE